MRVALFSPMPPARSGIADYSAALACELSRLLDLEIYSGAPAGFESSAFDAVLYQLGNNPHHEFVYEAALANAGIAVLHEGNLHHLVAGMSIGRGDWDAYLRECEYEGGPDALAYARRVRALEVGPDYDGLPMTRRLFEHTRGIVVHSCHMLEQVRRSGFKGPVARIPHGAWLPEADRLACRERLGLAENAPLIGVFGFLKPYKRIAESLRAFRRLVKVEPRARMILVGEPHPDLPLHALIKSLGVAPQVRVLGFTPVEEFNDCMAACDAVLNLRYPTVGESSGTLLRAMGLGRPVLVSDIGSFKDFPDDVCLKVPVGPGEEDTIYEFLNLLVSRPDVAERIGERARAYVERECNWRLVAQRYCEFLESLAGAARAPEPEPQAEAPQPAAAVADEEVREWTADRPEPRAYVEEHITRLVRTLDITPPGGPADRVLEMGSYLQITRALAEKLGYGEVRGCYYGPAGTVEHRTATSIGGRTFECDIDLFDAEKDAFPYPDAHFATVLCCELIEHLSEDPMHMMAEINRILRRGGHVVMTTPNVASLRAISAILQGYHPGFFSQYIRPNRKGEVEARHSREYAPREVRRLLEDAGFEVLRLETGPFRDQPRPELGWVRKVIQTCKLPDALRGDGIYAVGRKAGPVRNRWPEWLYAG